jgi:hypothetical protein
MTLTKDMTDESLRIELAGLRGWKKTTYREQGYVRGATDGELWLDPDGKQHSLFEDDDRPGDPYPFEDWPRDLNACHEAEKALGFHKKRSQMTKLEGKRHFAYQNALSAMLTIEEDKAFATARQRTEALVEVLRKRGTE